VDALIRRLPIAHQTAHVTLLVNVHANQEKDVLNVLMLHVTAVLFQKPANAAVVVLKRPLAIALKTVHVNHVKVVPTLYTIVVAPIVNVHVGMPTVNVSVFQVEHAQVVSVNANVMLK